MAKAYGKGGALETVMGVDNEKPTGVFFEEQTIESICKAVKNFEEVKDKIKLQSCRKNAERFGNERFIEEIERVIL